MERRKKMFQKTGQGYSRKPPNYGKAGCEKWVPQKGKKCMHTVHKFGGGKKFAWDLRGGGVPQKGGETS